MNLLIAASDTLTGGTGGALLSSAYSPQPSTPSDASTKGGSKGGDTGGSTTASTPVQLDTNGHGQTAAHQTCADGNG
ncbi:hypothetical protein HII28_02465 [Planctomonas sp. JC2975]|uniref:hypothetical protein n=1 Tax=Planctomonas sp. JC2975 TaxID=2729626 RepID=UPI001474003F|nr:hypothetical protein [Planctomonas sp. JC2975]NNC10750.1 hypothetical protein [Planctomonas sp. JC2975]